MLKNVTSVKEIQKKMRGYFIFSNFAPVFSQLGTIFILYGLLSHSWIVEKKQVDTNDIMYKETEFNKLISSYNSMTNKVDIIHGIGLWVDCYYQINSINMYCSFLMNKNSSSIYTLNNNVYLVILKIVRTVLILLALSGIICIIINTFYNWLTIKGVVIQTSNQMISSFKY